MHTIFLPWALVTPFALRNKNVLDKLYYNFMQRLILVGSEQSTSDAGTPTSAALQLGIRYEDEIQVKSR